MLSSARAAHGWHRTSELEHVRVGCRRPGCRRARSTWSGSRSRTSWTRATGCVPSAVQPRGSATSIVAEAARLEPVPTPRSMLVRRDVDRARRRAPPPQRWPLVVEAPGDAYHACLVTLEQLGLLDPWRSIGSRSSSSAGDSEAACWRCRERDRWHRRSCRAPASAPPPTTSFLRAISSPATDSHAETVVGA